MPSSTHSAELAGFSLRWGARIPMRDGAHLNGTVYLPAADPEPAPCLFALTPYTADRHYPYATFFARSGMPFVTIDVRGRGNSEGKFEPFAHEARDGHDIAEWLACQPYCNGKVGMWGGSYLGYAQWAAARERPAHLSTIVPAAAPFLGVDFPMRNGSFRPSLMRWITVTSGRASQLQLFSDTRFWSGLYRDLHQSGRPFREFDSMVGNPSSIFQEWLSHAEPDAYWDARNPTPEQYARIEIPILTITGSYDDDQPGALEHYRQHMRHATPAARAKHYLVIGPWDHVGCTGLPTTEFGGLRFAPEAFVDLLTLQLEWHAWTMGSGPRPALLRKHVTWYVMGAERWRYADTLEDITARHETLFLDSTGAANSIDAAGSLGARVGQGSPDTYCYDPRDARAPEIEAEALADGSSLVDQTVTLALSGRQFIYHSQPFVTDTEISGFFRLSIWLSIDCPDTDFFVSVHEIGPHGKSIRLTTDAMRARYREGLRDPRLIHTKDPLLYEFSRFTFVSREIRRGHRLRLIVAPMGRVIETNFVQKNYNGGGIVASESARSGRPVTVTLFHDEAHPSRLHIPIGAP